MRQILLFITLNLLVIARAFSQKFEISTLFSIDRPNYNKMANFPVTYSPNFRVGFFPVEHIPFGIELEYNFTNYHKFSRHYNFSTDAINPSNNIMVFKNNLSRRLIGIKWSDKQKEKLINPYITAKIGWGTLKSKIIEQEHYYSYEIIETEDDDGYVTSEEEGYVTSRIRSEKLVLSEETIYSLESGIEFNFYSLAPVFIQLSAGYTGSFSKLKYNTDFITSTEGDYESVKADFLNNAFLKKGKLSLFQFSIGFIFKL